MRARAVNEIKILQCSCRGSPAHECGAHAFFGSTLQNLLSVSCYHLTQRVRQVELQFFSFEISIEDDTQLYVFPIKDATDVLPNR